MLAAGHPNIQLHDVIGAGDMNSTANLSASECASLCCNVPRCMAFFHTTNASMWNNNCGPHPCCWIKPSFKCVWANMRVLLSVCAVAER